MKKKRLFALITSAFFILSACGTAAANQEDNSWSNVEKKKELVVATSGTLFPASYYNDQNELVGYDVDLAKEVAKRLNVKISFKEYNVDGQITSVSK
ncbi:transporter substrate-binding domain-containing protein, partial [Enterococcus faecium]